jgi:hypothetical protein
MTAFLNGRLFLLTLASCKCIVRTEKSGNQIRVTGMTSGKNGGGKINKFVPGGIEKQADQDTIYFEKPAGHNYGNEEQH